MAGSGGGAFVRVVAGADKLPEIRIEERGGSNGGGFRGGNGGSLRPDDAGSFMNTSVLESGFTVVLIVFDRATKGFDG